MSRDRRGQAGQAVGFSVEGSLSGAGLACDPCLERLCVSKDANGRITAISFWDDSGNLNSVPTCGSGSGSGSGGGTVTVSCCPNPLSTTLYWAFSGGSTDPGITLAYDAGLGAWTGRGTRCGFAGTAKFACVGSHWVVTFTRDYDGAGTTMSQTSVTCDPFDWVGTGSPWANPGTCTNIFTVTVTG